MALRPREMPSSMSSWKGSQALAEGLRVGAASTTGAPFSAPESVVASMAGFDGAELVASPLEGSRNQGRSSLLKPWGDPIDPTIVRRFRRPSDTPQPFPAEYRSLSQCAVRSSQADP